MVLVPGKSTSAIVSRMVPIPSSSSVPGSFKTETRSRTDRRSRSLLSNQLSVDTGKIVTHQQRGAYERLESEDMLWHH